MRSPTKFTEPPEFEALRWTRVDSRTYLAGVSSGRGVRLAGVLFNVAAPDHFGIGPDDALPTYSRVWCCAESVDVRGTEVFLNVPPLTADMTKAERLANLDEAKRAAYDAWEVDV